MRLEEVHKESRPVQELVRALLALSYGWWAALCHEAVGSSSATVYITRRIAKIVEAQDVEDAVFSAFEVDDLCNRLILHEWNGVLRKALAQVSENEWKRLDNYAMPSGQIKRNCGIVVRNCLRHLVEYADNVSENVVVSSRFHSSTGRADLTVPS
ncbi:hypothetical protein JCM10212_001088 [Sporobolomyces blumeae]